MPLPPIPNDILAAEPSLRAEFVNDIESIVDAAQPATVPGEGNDLILANNLANNINGLSGNDAIAAFGGNDTVRGGFGNDYVLAGAGNDAVLGGDGNDILFGELGDDRMWGEDGDDAMFGGAGNDVMNGGLGNDWMFGNAGTDLMTGGFGNDLLDGGDGNDNLNAANGNDTLLGGAGADVISAGADNDFIEGGAGADRMTGGLGDDVFHYALPSHGADRIFDFSSSEDRFEFAGVGFGVDPGTNLDDGTTFIANAAPTAVVADATVLYETDTGRLTFDADGIGAGAAVLIATLSGAPMVDNQDFIFV